jgi:hypothetical protein
MLLRLLDAPDGGVHAARLLAFLAPSSAGEDLIRLARDRDRPYWHRVYALRGLARADVPLPEDAFVDLLGEILARPLPPGGAACARPPSTPPLGELVALAARVRTHHDKLVDHLARATPEARRELLASIVSLEEKPSPRLETWLVERWLEESLRRGPDVEDCHVARAAAPEYPEALAVLEAFWRERPIDDGFFWDLLQHSDLATNLDEPRRAEALAALVLPIPDLHAALGPGGLRRVVRRVLVDHSFARRCPVDKTNRPPEYTVRAALAFVKDEPEGPELAAKLLAHVKLHPDVRAALGLALFHRYRKIVLHYMEVRGADEDNHPLVRAVLREIRKNPDTRDRRALLSVLGSPDPETRYLALDALESVGETRHLNDGLLAALAGDPHPVVQLRATAALARHGDAPRMAALVDTARKNPSVVLRAEAIRLLGALPLVAQDPFHGFECALLEDHALDDSEYHAPASEQAAIALGAAFGANALTALLQGHLRARSNAALDAIEAAIEVILEEVEGGARRTPVTRRLEIITRDGGHAAGFCPFSARA